MTYDLGHRIWDMRNRTDKRNRPKYTGQRTHGIGHRTKGHSKQGTQNKGDRTKHKGDTGQIGSRT